MNIIYASYTIMTYLSPHTILLNLAEAARVCHQSDFGDKEKTFESSKKLITNIIILGHESVLEHESVTVRIICDRGISHQIVRHRLASYCQESTRACRYSEVTFIKPCFWPENSDSYLAWHDAMQAAERSYQSLLELGATAQEARSVLPNSVKTELVMTANLREWRLFFKLRAAGLHGKPHPQMLEITVPMLQDFKRFIPVVFDDIVVK